MPRSGALDPADGSTCASTHAYRKCQTNTANARKKRMALRTTPSPGCVVHSPGVLPESETCQRGHAKASAGMSDGRGSEATEAAMRKLGLAISDSLGSAALVAQAAPSDELFLGTCSTRERAQVATRSGRPPARRRRPLEPSVDGSVGRATGRRRGTARVEVSSPPRMTTAMGRSTGHRWSRPLGARTVRYAGVDLRVRVLVGLHMASTAAATHGSAVGGIVRSRSLPGELAPHPAAGKMLAEQHVRAGRIDHQRALQLSPLGAPPRE